MCLPEAVMGRKLRIQRMLHFRWSAADTEIEIRF